MQTVVPLHEAESSEKRGRENKKDVVSDRLVYLNESGDRARRRVERLMPVRLGVNACMHPTRAGCVV